MQKAGNGADRGLRWVCQGGVTGRPPSLALQSRGIRYILAPAQSDPVKISSLCYLTDEPEITGEHIGSHKALDLA